MLQVISYPNLRLSLAIAASKGFLIHYLDIKTAFLIPPLAEEVYMSILPEGYGSISSNKMCRLKKCLYGLKQSPHNWNKTMNEFLLSIEFNPMDHESCLYVIKDDGVIIAILCLFVDDIVFAADSKCFDKV